MIISDSHQFIFFHVPKVAGSSIRAALDSYANFSTKWIINRALVKLRLRRYLLNLPHYKLRMYKKHLGASEAKEKLPQSVFSHYFKFAFVRNPWDWQVSLYHYILNTPKQEQHQIVKDLQDFNHYLKWRVEEAKKLQSDFLVDAEGNLLVDFVGKYEKLHIDLKAISSRLALPDLDLPHLNASGHKDYRTYYRPDTVDLVSRHFREDIDRFGYHFD